MKRRIGLGFLLSLCLFGAAQAQSPRANPPDGVDVRDYGAKCDGATDDTAALQSAFKAGAGRQIIFPAGTCRYSALTLKGSGTSLIGQGRSATVLQQTTAKGDGLYIGDPAKPGTVVNSYNYVIAHMTIFPAVAKTEGFAVHLHNVEEVLFFDMETGNDVLNAYGGGNRNFGGVWVDNAGSAHFEQVELWAKGDVLRINGSTDSALHFANLRYGAIGLHAAGGMQGFHCTQSNIESNTNNMMVDNSQDAATPNKSAVFGAGCAFDTSGADNIVIDTPLGGLDQWVWSASSIATENGAAIDVVSAPNHTYLIFNATAIGSYSGKGVGDGIRLQDPSVFVSVTGATQIYSNTGYGIRETYDPANPERVYVDPSTIWSIAGHGNKLGNANFALTGR